MPEEPVDEEEHFVALLWRPLTLIPVAEDVPDPSHQAHCHEHISFLNALLIFGRHIVQGN